MIETFAAITVLLGAAQPAESTTDARSDSSAAAPETQDGAQPADQRSFGVEAVDDMAASVMKIGANLKEARRGLSDGQTGEPTRHAQRAVIAELEKLINASKSGDPSSNPDPPNPSEQPPSNESNPSSPMDIDRGERRRNPNPEGEPTSPTGATSESKAAESMDRPPEERTSGGTLRDFRANMVRDAWGHLPPRLRDQLLNSGSDKYLPQYDSLVRSYFESLARPARDGDHGIGQGGKSRE